MKQKEKYVNENDFLKIVMIVVIIFLSIIILAVLVGKKFDKIEQQIPYEKCESSFVNEKYVIESSSVQKIDCDVKNIKCFNDAHLRIVNYCDLDWDVAISIGDDDFPKKEYYNINRNETITCIGTREVKTCEIVYPKKVD